MRRCNSLIRRNKDESFALIFALFVALISGGGVGEGGVSIIVFSEQFTSNLYALISPSVMLLRSHRELLLSLKSQKQTRYKRHIKNIIHD